MHSNVNNSSIYKNYDMEVSISRFSSVLFSCSVISASLLPNELQHNRPPCPSPTPRACSKSRLFSQWCHPTISSCRSLLLLPSIFPRIRVSSNESALCIRWPKYCSFSFSISPGWHFKFLMPYISISMLL